MDGDVNLLQYYAGVEFEPGASPWTAGIIPFVGLGVGGRSCDFRAARLATRSSVVGYVALGGERRFQRTGLRVEARTYASRDTSALADATARFDVMLLAGLSYHFR